MEKQKYSLLVDTREQNPLPFRGAIRKKLDFGDYAAETPDGIILPIVFERKSPVDAWSTLTSGHRRFKEELHRADCSNQAIVVIVECSYGDFIHKRFNGAYHSKVKPFIVSKILHKMMSRYFLPFIFVNGRKEAAEFIKNTFNALAEDYDEEKFKNLL